MSKIYSFILHLSIGLSSLDINGAYGIHQSSSAYSGLAYNTIFEINNPNTLPNDIFFQDI